METREDFCGDIQDAIELGPLIDDKRVQDVRYGRPLDHALMKYHICPTCLYNLSLLSVRGYRFPAHQ